MNGWARSLCETSVEDLNCRNLGLAPNRT